MKILLVNTNRYRTPPVPPLGLAHLAGALRGTAHEYRVLDLCFSDDPAAVIEKMVRDFSPRVAGLTVRNIDTVISRNNVFFLDDIAVMVRCFQRLGVPVLLGGAGYSFCPEGILRYTGADWGIAGPGENAVVTFLDIIETDQPPAGTVLDGRDAGVPPFHQAEWPPDIDLLRYMNERGILGFETQKGCTESCPYCPEGIRKITFRNPESIVSELSAAADRGFTRFHLCDTEFNQNLEFCKTFLTTLIGTGLEITWVLYMKSSPCDEELFRLLKRSGASMVTLSLPTGDGVPGNASDICRFAKDCGIKIAVDVLVGLPGESIDTVRRTIETLRAIGPDTVGVNSTYRLYPGLAATRRIMDSPEERTYLTGCPVDDPDFIRPVFYNRISVELLREIIGDDPLFTIEGFERTSNYERV